MTTTRTRTTPRAWWVVAATAVVIMTAGATTTMSGRLVAPLHDEFGWTHGAIGVAVSLNMVLYGVTSPFAVAWMDRFGIRPVVLPALLLIAVGTGGTAFMADTWQFTLLWGLCVGLGTGSLSMVFAALVAGRWFTERRGLVTGLLTASSVLGQFAFLPALSWLADHQGWRAPMIVLAAAAAVAALCAVALLRDHPPGVHPEPVPGALTRAVRVLFTAGRTLPFWLLAGMFAICGATTNGLMWSHFTPAAHDHGMALTTASSLLALIGFFNVAGTVSAGWLIDNVDPRLVLATCFGLRAGTLFLLPVLLTSHVSVPLVAFVVAFGVLDVATVPPTIAICREFYGDDGAIVFGWVNGAHQIGAGLMAVSGAVVRDSSGSYDPVWVGAGVLCVLAAVVSRRIGSV